jgi:hypothetical protein
VARVLWKRDVQAVLDSRHLELRRPVRTRWPLGTSQHERREEPQPELRERKVRSGQAGRWMTYWLFADDEPTCPGYKVLGAVSAATGAAVVYLLPRYNRADAETMFEHLCELAWGDDDD